MSRECWTPPRDFRGLLALEEEIAQANADGNGVRDVARKLAQEARAKAKLEMRVEKCEIRRGCSEIVLTFEGGFTETYLTMRNLQLDISGGMI